MILTSYGKMMNLLFDTIVNDHTPIFGTESMVFIANVIEEIQHEQHVENTTFCLDKSARTPEKNMFTEIEYGTKI
jgi:hypothetical protein